MATTWFEILIEVWKYIGILIVGSIVIALICAAVMFSVSILLTQVSNVLG